MARRHKSQSATVLADHTFGLTELTVHFVHPNQKNMELLPYPDDNFNDTIDVRCKRNNKFTIEHIYSRDGRAFIPDISIHIKPITVQHAHQGLIQSYDSYIYCVSIEHGPFQWLIHKQYAAFRELHNALMQFVNMHRRISTSNIDSNPDKDDECPWFPRRNERRVLTDRNKTNEFCNDLTNYLNRLVRHPKFRAHPATCKFFNISCLSFIDGLSISQKEGSLLERSNNINWSRHSHLGQPILTEMIHHHHNEKWFVIKDTYVVYMDLDTNEIRFPILVDRNFNVTLGHRHIDTYYRIKIKNLQCQTVAKCQTIRDRDEWMQCFKPLIKQCYGFVGENANRFNSYAPIRENQLAHWFINGKSYMKAVAKALLTAKEEVFITDWWLSPEIMMIRPTKDDTYRLDNLLGAIAANGVRVYIMVFKEMKRILSLSSLYTKKKLTSKNKEGYIKVIRHPDHHNQNRVFMWSHHDKMVVIDQKIAFVGGIDLCYGRWDDEYMRLVDLGDENITTLSTQSENDTTELPTKRITDQAYSAVLMHEDHMAEIPNYPNETIEHISPSDLSHTNNAQSSKDSSNTKWKKSYQTGADKHGLRGELDSDESTLSHGFMFKGRNHVVLEEESQSNGWRQLRKNERKSSDDSDSEESLDEQQPVSPPISDIDRQRRLFIGKDYANDYVKGFEKPEQATQDNIDRTKIPRMPWHDEALVVFGQAARDVARHFIQRWNIHKCEKELNNDLYPFLLPKSYSDIQSLTVDDWKEFLDDEPYCVDTQCVRSVGLWSAGVKSTESSIQNAYIQMIGAANHYIYMENQFFITISGDECVQNGLADALFHRIKKAHELHEKFRIYVVIPLFPGFNSFNALHAVLFFIMCSIAKGDNSLFSRLIQAGISPDNYIKFFGMRNHDVLMGRLVTEIIYVHSKLMIVDDRMAICGSANINDRSLLGNRDSEFCVVIQDREEVYGRFDGKPVRVGKFCSSWRKKIFEMLLGIHLENPDRIDVTDPICDEFFIYFGQVALKNALIYEEVFGTVPTNRVRTFAQSKEYNEAKYMKDIDPKQAQEKLKNIQGFVVEYPVYFLHEEHYLPNARTPEGIVPLTTWT